MAQSSGKRVSKRKNVEQASAPEVILQRMSGPTASVAVDDCSSLPPSAEASDGEQSVSAVLPRVRSVKKKNYTDSEMEVLVDEIIANYRTLFPKKSDKCPMPVRTAAWNNIMLKVNSIGVAKRSVRELKKKWSDLKKKVKAKMAAISHYASQTGGGPSFPEQLTTIEEKVGATCRREQIEGFGMADVCMQALASRETNMSEINEDRNTQAEETAEETMVQPGSDGADETAASTSCPVNPPPQTIDLLLPDDLGLSQTQTTYINNYTNEHLQFMRRVESRFDNLEKGFNTMAEAYLTGAQTICHGLNKIANLMECKSGSLNQNLNSQTTTRPLSVEIASPVAQFRHDYPGSPSSNSTENSLGSAITLPSNIAGSASPYNSVSLEQDSASSEALDLSILNKSVVSSQGRPTSLERAGELNSSAANFLQACKKEMASSTDRQDMSVTMTPTLGTRKSLGTSRKVPLGLQK